MIRKSTSHMLGIALLASLMALSITAPAAASPRKTDAERNERGTQATQPGRMQRMDVRIDADDARPAAPPRRASQPAERPQREVRVNPAVPRIAESRPRFEAQRQDWRMPRSSDDERRENWGELARQQQERRQAVEQARNEQTREQQRQRIERFRAEQQRIEVARPALRDNPNAERPHSLQSQLIGQVREREAMRDHDAPRPDWRGQQNGNRNDEARIGNLQQRQRIDQQRHQHNQWQRDESRRRADYDRHRHGLERHRRHAQQRYYRDYWQRWQAAQLRWDRYRFDYYRDPFFQIAFNYHYSYGGRWYSTNRYGASLLEQAIRDGYREGWRAGRADREDDWRFDYQGNYGWIDGSYGYGGYYVSLSDYRWYFRQGFERGYRDGYYSRYQYGRYDRDGAVILPAVLSLILAFSIR